MNTRGHEQLIDRLGHPRVLIVGDLILDRYVSGDVSRISPEAPIPVLAATRTEERMGGAGNVAANLAAMEAEVDIVGVVGDDLWGHTLRGMLGQLGIDCAGCVVDPTRPTIQKTRMMSGGHQMLRVDEEDPRPINDTVRQEILAGLPNRVRQARAVVLSDYGKGALTPEVVETVIAAARAAGVPVLVDPKGDDYRRYRGATLVTPNQKEAEQAIGRKLTGRADLPAAADDLMRIAELDAAVITLGPDGMYFKSRDGAEGHVPAQARDVFDVTGAGDTVVAQLAFGLADGLSLELAAALANQAAAIVVGRLGTHAVTRRELRAAFEGARDKGKIARGADLDRLLAAWRGEGRRLVFLNGSFDVLAVGDVRRLRRARARGDVLLVGVENDPGARPPGSADRPLNSLEDRMDVLAALEVVDAVTPLGESTPAAIIERIAPHVVVDGAEGQEKQVVSRDWVEANAARWCSLHACTENRPRAS